MLFLIMTYHPSLEEFKEKAGQGNLIPVYKEILADLDTPVSAYMKISQDSHSFLLESIEGGDKWARYSFLGLRLQEPMLAKQSSTIMILECT